MESIGQIQTDFKMLTDQEQQYINTTKSLYKEYRKLNKAYRKDSAKLLKKIYKEVRVNVKDSAKLPKPATPGLRRAKEAEINQRVQVISDSLYQYYGLESYEQLAASYENHKNGEINAEHLYKEKLKPEGEKYLSELDEYDQAKKLQGEAEIYTENIENVKQMAQNPDTLFTSIQIDQLAEKGFRKLEASKELNAMQQREKTFLALVDLPAEMQDKMMQRLGKNRELIEKGKELDTDGAKDLALQEGKKQGKALADKLLEEYGNKVDGAVGGVNRLKKKYQSITQQEGGELKKVKKSRFTDASIAKRLIIGGTFDILRQETIQIEFAPQVGYRLNKKVAIGAGSVFRIDFAGNGWYINDTSVVTNINGFNFFTEYVLYKGFYAYGEMEQLRTTQTTDQGTEKEQQTRFWVPGAKLGIGKQFRMHTYVNGTLMLVYKFLYYESATPRKSRWEFKFGYRLNGDGIRANNNKKANLERLKQRAKLDY